MYKQDRGKLIIKKITNMLSWLLWLYKVFKLQLTHSLEIFMDLNFYSIDFFMNSRKFKSFTLTNICWKIVLHNLAILCSVLKVSMKVSRQNYYALANYVPATYVKELRWISGPKCQGGHLFVVINIWRSNLSKGHTYITHSLSLFQNSIHKYNKG